MSRTKKSLRNIIIVLVGQGLGTLIAFVARTFFIQLLGKEYLGIDGLFTNILTVLTLTELGVGEAIVYSLYKPLAEKDTAKIQALMKLYKKVYNCIGIFVIVAGICITPFIEVFLSEQPAIDENLKILFIFFVMNTGMSYFYSYKRSLLIADQNKYITTIYKYACYLVLNILQITVLYLTHNYYLYLTLMVINTLAENVLISIKVNKMYPYLKDKNQNKVDKETKQQIIKNTKALMFHKVGSTVVNSTDSILISKLVGIVEVGMYSNYYLITNAFVTIINQIFNAVLASVGNLGVTADNDKKEQIFKIMNFINFLIYSFVTCGLITLFNPFISVWVGKDMVFPMTVVIVICINFYLNGMRRSVIVYRDALALYWYDRYKPIFEATINLICSIILGKALGIIGIILGTIISTITCCVYVEPHILYKYGFKRSAKNYFLTYFKYIAIVIIEVIIMMTLSNIIDIISLNIILEIFIKLILCLIIPNLINYLIFRKREECVFLIELLKKILNSIKNRMNKKVQV